MQSQCSPIMTTYCIRMVETLAAYVVLYEHIGSSKLLPITPNDLTTRARGRINQNNTWKDIAGRKIVDQLFKEFKLPAPPTHPRPMRPPPVKRGGPAPKDPRSGLLPGPSGGDAEEDDNGPPQPRSGHWLYKIYQATVGNLKDPRKDQATEDPIGPLNDQVAEGRAGYGQDARQGLKP